LQKKIKINGLQQKKIGAMGQRQLGQVRPQIGPYQAAPAQLARYIADSPVKPERVAQGPLCPRAQLRRSAAKHGVTGNGV